MNRQEIEIKKFFGKLLDSDSADHLVEPGSFISGKNIRIGTSVLGGQGNIENILRNAEKAHSLPVGVNTRIGFGADEENGYILKFNHNSNGNHAIYYYDVYANVWYTVLLSSQTSDGLKFDKYKLINACRIINFVAYWNDFLNRPRRIDIRAAINLNHPGTFSGIAGYSTPLDENILTVARKPPNYPPLVSKFQDGGVSTNLLALFAGKFAIHYTYRGNEISTISPYSKIVNYNVKADTSNAVSVKMSMGEKIPQDVKIIHLSVQYGIDPNFFVIKTWDRDKTSEATEIANHNAGVADLSFNFYNDKTGIPLSNSFSVKPFDNVPDLSEGLEIARNVLILANNTEGIDSPLTTSLTATLNNQTDGNTVTGRIFRLIYNSGATTRYVIQLALPANGGYYRVTANDAVLPTSPTAFSALTFVSANELDVFRYYVPTWPVPPINSFTYQSDVTVTGTPSVLVNQTCYKSGASYELATRFYNKYGVFCGSVPNGIIYKTAERTYSTVAFTVAINWSLTNVAATSQIPEEAEYYSIDRTKCLTHASFVQCRSRNDSQVKSMTYVNRDASNVLSFATSAYASTLFGVAINITNLQSFGMGYNFVDGDICKVYLGSAAPKYLRIIDQEGIWIICELVDLGALTATTDALFEIFTPYKPSTNEGFFEVGSIYPISNPGTPGREYSVLSGSIGGDVTLLSRTTSAPYITENMSPNDTYYLNWFTDAGRINVVTKLGKTTKPTGMSFSNVYIQGTSINGLSSFEAANKQILPEDLGAIRAIVLTKKVQKEGTVLVAIGEVETASVYLGETEITDSSGNNFLAKTTNFIGQVNVLGGGIGTSNPESIVRHNGMLFGYSKLRSCFWRYDVNGLDNISNAGLMRVANLFSEKYKTLSVAEIEAMGSRPFVFGGVDPYHEEIIWSIPATESSPPKGYLEDYSSPQVPYLYDVYDGVAKTLVFCSTQKGWGAPHEYQAEGFVDIGNILLSAKSGRLYRHNDTGGYNSFFGVSVKSAIGFLINEQADVKELLTLSVQGNYAPSWTHVRSESPDVQSSDIIGEWSELEGVFYASVFRDRLSPNTPGSFEEKLFCGDEMKADIHKVYMEWATGALLQIKFINAAYVDSVGHKTKTNARTS